MNESRDANTLEARQFRKERHEEPDVASGKQTDYNYMGVSAQYHPDSPNIPKYERIPQRLEKLKVSFLRTIERRGINGRCINCTE